MGQLKAYSQFFDETINIGLPSEDLDELLELGDTMATGRPGIIVYVENPPLQKWESS